MLSGFSTETFAKRSSTTSAPASLEEALKLPRPEEVLMSCASQSLPSLFDYQERVLSVLCIYIGLINRTMSTTFGQVSQTFYRKVILKEENICQTLNTAGVSV